MSQKKKTPAPEVAAARAEPSAPAVQRYQVVLTRDCALGAGTRKRGAVLGIFASTDSIPPTSGFEGVRFDGALKPVEVQHLLRNPQLVQYVLAE